MIERLLRKTRVLGVGVVILTGVGCTKVNEQPPAAPLIAPEPTTAPVKKIAPRPPSFAARATTAFAGGGGVSTGAAPGRAAADAGLPVNSLNGDPAGLKKEDLRRALDGAMAGLATCFGSEPGGGAGLSFDADPSGKAANVKVTGASPAATACISNQLAGIKLPAFAGKAVPVEFPLSVHRQAPPPAAAPAAAAAAAAAESAAAKPSAFMQPTTAAPTTAPPPAAAAGAGAAKPGSGFVQP